VVDCVQDLTSDSKRCKNL